MNQQQIVSTAITLRTELQHFAKINFLVSALDRSLSHLIEDAISGRITNPIKTSSVPANRVWTEGELDDMPPLSEAYGAFCAALTGTE